MLLPGEVVHHIDGDKENNDPSNLAVMRNEEHSSLHRKGSTFKISAEDKEAERRRRYEKNGGTWFSKETIEKFRQAAQRQRYKQ